MWFSVAPGKRGGIGEKKIHAGQTPLTEINVTGSLVRFSSRKGRGLIQRDDTGTEVRVYASAFDDLKLGKPKTSMPLLFDVEQRIRRRGTESVAVNLRLRLM